MSAVPGLGNANLRLTPPPEDPASPAQITVDIDAPEGDIPDIDERGNILKISHGDGSVSISLDGKPLGSVEAANDGPIEWFANLIDRIDADELSGITEDLLRGVDDDLQSRQEWIEDRAQGIKLLGLKIEIPNVQGASDGAPVEGMSKVRHPLLLEAVLRFQLMVINIVGLRFLGAVALTHAEPIKVNQVVYITKSKACGCSAKSVRGGRVGKPGFFRAAAGVAEAH